MPEGVQGTQGGQPPREPYQEETNSQVMSGVDASAPASNSVPAGARTGTASSGQEEYDPNDDKALKALLAKVTAAGQGEVQDHLMKQVDDNKMITENAFAEFLNQFNTPNREQIRMFRIAGYTRYQNQKLLIGDILNRFENRDAQKEMFADQTLKTIVQYVDDDASIDNMHDQFAKEKGELGLTRGELIQMLSAMGVNADRQLTLIVFNMFDTDRNGYISKQELKDKLTPYIVKRQNGEQ